VKGKVHLGYEVGSGEPVSIPVRHMAITGQTQESGKTTALEALISRSGLKSVAFITKRGEASFQSGRRILPFFKERTDWQFVESILESIMRERMSFKRPWLMRSCEGAKTLADIQSRAHDLMKKSKNAFSEDMYMLLSAYFETVVPLIASLPKIGKLDLQPGLNVMDLLKYPEELQMLVISSTLEWIYRHESDVITVIPEAWKFVPQGRKTPAKLIVEKLAREGAGLKNYIWMDAQDLAGVEKMLLRAAAVWMIGVQREANELKRAISNMPEGVKRPKAAQVAQLELGQFYVCHGQYLQRAYVQPAWMDDEGARAIALDPKKIHSVSRDSHNPTREPEKADPPQPPAGPAGPELPAGGLVDEPGLPEREAEEMPRTYTATELKQVVPEIDDSGVSKLLDFLNNGIIGHTPKDFSANGSPRSPLPADEASLVAKVVEQIRRDPTLIRLAAVKPAIEIKISPRVLNLDDSGTKGKIARLMSEHWFDKPRTFTEIKNELVRRGLEPKTPNVRISEPLKQFTQDGFFWRGDNSSYILAPDVDVKKVQQ
jgi:hypothetical protein